MRLQKHKENETTATTSWRCVQSQKFPALLFSDDDTGGGGDDDENISDDSICHLLSTNVVLGNAFGVL